jgi:hypothetical protein
MSGDRALVSRWIVGWLVGLFVVRSWGVLTPAHLHTSGSIQEHPHVRRGTHGRSGAVGFSR